MKVLVLNVSYEPLMIIPWTRALSLIYRGRARVVEEYDRVIRSVSIELKMPAVISLDQYIRPRNIIAFSKKSIYIRDNFTCQYCGVKKVKSSLTIDHVYPKSLGGRLRWNNIVSACLPCNQKKADKLLSDTTLRLARKPSQPLSIYNFLWDMPSSRVPKEWEDYIVLPK